MENSNEKSTSKSLNLAYVPIVVVVLTLLGSLVTWSLNEKNKRAYEEYKRKEERYSKLVESVTGFYKQGLDTELRKEFLKQLNLCWLYCPDEVIRKAYRFLEVTKSRDKFSREEKQKRLGDLVLEIRRDLLQREELNRTNLTSEEFQLLYAREKPK